MKSKLAKQITICVSFLKGLKQYTFGCGRIISRLPPMNRVNATRVTFMSNRKQRGFTLIELVTTLGVATILISMAVPGINVFLLNSRQSSSVNELVSAMHLARSSAITKKSRFTICASSAGATCENVEWDRGWILFGDTDSDQTVDVGEIIVGTGAAIDGLTIESSEFARYFMYRPNGRVMNATINANAGEFTICDTRGAGHARVVILDVAGRPRLSETESDGSAPSCI